MWKYDLQSCLVAGRMTNLRSSQVYKQLELWKVRGANGKILTTSSSRNMVAYKCTPLRNFVRTPTLSGHSIAESGRSIAENGCSRAESGRSRAKCGRIEVERRAAAVERRGAERCRFPRLLSALLRPLTALLQPLHVGVRWFSDNVPQRSALMGHRNMPKVSRLTGTRALCAENCGEIRRCLGALRSAS